MIPAIAKAHKSLCIKNDAFLKAIEESISPGDLIEYRHGNQLRLARVERIGWDRIRLYSSNPKSRDGFYWIYALRITRNMTRQK